MHSNLLNGEKLGGIHVFIPLIAVLFIVATLYFGRNSENKSKPQKTATELSLKKIFVFKVASPQKMEADHI
ncbi:unnamed protein product [Wuchereria bancrofti]|uniref:Uncharacterized protein n=1 Tax=Wuchereria bancrofti TaxID=6293 RepID=A0A3P7DBN6_WUCBA|nr:unnamed protein product [Wuchereria bancrofti]